jgi:chromosome segregation ATPase
MSYALDKALEVMYHITHLHREQDKFRDALSSKDHIIKSLDYDRTEATKERERFEGMVRVAEERLAESLRALSDIKIANEHLSSQLASARKERDETRAVLTDLAAELGDFEHNYKAARDEARAMIVELINTPLSTPEWARVFARVARAADAWENKP